MPENDHATPSTGREANSADTFALVAHEIRVEVIEILGQNPSEPELSLSEIRSRLSTDVEPSQVYYHVQQLVGNFVEKTDGGYSLRPAGSHLCLALHAGTFDHQREHLSIEANIDCYNCQAPAEVNFDEGWYRIECSECTSNYGIGILGVPLEAFEDVTDAFSHVKKYAAIQTVFLSYGVCPSCIHPLYPTIQESTEDRQLRKVRIYQPCDLCGAAWSLTVGRTLLTDPGLIAFGHDHGVDLLSTPHWELEFAATDEHLTVHSTDPWKVALEVAFDDEALELVMDGGLNIIERNRPRKTGNVHQSLLDEVVLPGKVDCLEYIRRHRWPDRVTCPSCESSDTIKKGSTSQGAKRYKCNTCDIWFNDLTGTVFAEHHLSLPEMFFIIQEMGSRETTQIAHQLDHSHQTVLDFAQKVKEANDTGGFSR